MMESGIVTLSLMEPTAVIVGLVTGTVPVFTSVADVGIVIIILV
jgi:hypothetical protein